MASFSDLSVETLLQIIGYALPDRIFIPAWGATGPRPDPNMTRLLLVNRNIANLARSVIRQPPMIDFEEENSFSDLYGRMPPHIILATTTIICRLKVLRSLGWGPLPQNLQEAHIRTSCGFIRRAAVLPRNHILEFARVQRRASISARVIAPYYRNVFQRRRPASFEMHAWFKKRTGNPASPETWVSTHKP